LITVTGNINWDKRKVFAFNNKKLAVTLLVNYYIGVIHRLFFNWDFLSQFLLSYSNQICKGCIETARKSRFWFLVNFSLINSYWNQTCKGCIETARKSKFWFLVNFSLRNQCLENIYLLSVCSKHSSFVPLCIASTVFQLQFVTINTAPLWYLVSMFQHLYKCQYVIHPSWYINPSKCTCRNWQT